MYNYISATVIVLGIACMPAPSQSTNFERDKYVVRTWNDFPAKKRDYCNTICTERFLSRLPPSWSNLDTCTPNCLEAPGPTYVLLFVKNGQLQKVVEYASPPVKVNVTKWTVESGNTNYCNEHRPLEERHGTPTLTAHVSWEHYPTIHYNNVGSLMFDVNGNDMKFSHGDEEMTMTETNYGDRRVYVRIASDTKRCKLKTSRQAFFYIEKEQTTCRAQFNSKENVDASGLDFFRDCWFDFQITLEHPNGYIRDMNPFLKGVYTSQYLTTVPQCIGEHCHCSNYTLSYAPGFPKRTPVHDLETGIGSLWIDIEWLWCLEEHSIIYNSSTERRNYTSYSVKVYKCDITESALDTPTNEAGTVRLSEKQAVTKIQISDQRIRIGPVDADETYKVELQFHTNYDCHTNVVSKVVVVADENSQDPATLGDVRRTKTPDVSKWNCPAPQDRGVTNLNTFEYKVLTWRNFPEKIVEYCRRACMVADKALIPRSWTADCTTMCQRTNGPTYLILKKQNETTVSISEYPSAPFALQLNYAVESFAPIIKLRVTWEYYPDGIIEDTSEYTYLLYLVQEGARLMTLSREDGRGNGIVSLDGIDEQTHIIMSRTDEITIVIDNHFVDRCESSIANGKREITVDKRTRLKEIRLIERYMPDTGQHFRMFNCSYSLELKPKSHPKERLCFLRTLIDGPAVARIKKKVPKCQTACTCSDADFQIKIDSAEMIRDSNQVEVKWHITDDKNLKLLNQRLLNYNLYAMNVYLYQPFSRKMKEHVRFTPESLESASAYTIENYGWEKEHDLYRYVADVSQPSIDVSEELLKQYYLPRTWTSDELIEEIVYNESMFAALPVFNRIGELNGPIDYKDFQQVSYWYASLIPIYKFGDYSSKLYLVQWNRVAGIELTYKLDLNMDAVLNLARRILGDPSSVVPFDYDTVRDSNRFVIPAIPKSCNAICTCRDVGIIIDSTTVSSTESKLEIRWHVDAAVEILHEMINWNLYNVQVDIYQPLRFEQKRRVPITPTSFESAQTLNLYQSVPEMSGYTLNVSEGIMKHRQLFRTGESSQSRFEYDECLSAEENAYIGQKALDSSFNPWNLQELNLTIYPTDPGAWYKITLQLKSHCGCGHDYATAFAAIPLNLSDPSSTIGFNTDVTKKQKFPTQRTEWSDKKGYQHAIRTWDNFPAKKERYCSNVCQRSNAALIPSSWNGNCLNACETSAGPTYIQETLTKYGEWIYAQEFRSAPIAINVDWSFDLQVPVVYGTFSWEHYPDADGVNPSLLDIVPGDYSLSDVDYVLKLDGEERRIRRMPYHCSFNIELDNNNDPRCISSFTDGRWFLARPSCDSHSFTWRINDEFYPDTNMVEKMFGCTFRLTMSFSNSSEKYDEMQELTFSPVLTHRTVTVPPCGEYCKCYDLTIVFEPHELSQTTHTVKVSWHVDSDLSKALQIHMLKYNLYSMNVYLYEPLLSVDQVARSPQSFEAAAELTTGTETDTFGLYKLVKGLSDSQIDVSNRIVSSQYIDRNFSERAECLQYNEHMSFASRFLGKPDIHTGKMLTVSDLQQLNVTLDPVVAGGWYRIDLQSRSQYGCYSNKATTYLAIPVDLTNPASTVGFNVDLTLTNTT